MFLESNIPAYLASSKGSRQGFWHELYSDWWKRYPWKLEDSQEPPTEDPDEMARLASVQPGEEPKKALVEQQLTNVGQLFTFVDQYRSSYVFSV